MEHRVFKEEIKSAGDAALRPFNEVPRQAMDEYERAINFDGGNICVSASAGCGKTTTMIRRIERLIVKDGVEVTQLLVITFTRSAAAEMKEKLKQALIRHPKGSFAYSQIKNLEIADISTIDSFCSKVCGEFFNVADIPPQFSIIEENDSKLYRAKVISEMVEDYYAEGDELFSELSSIFSYDRTDKGVISAVEQLYELTAVMPDFEEYLKKTAFIPYGDVEGGLIARFITGDFHESMRDFSRELSAHIRLMAGENLDLNLEKFSALAAKLFQVDREGGLEHNRALIEETLSLLGERNRQGRGLNERQKLIHDKGLKLLERMKRALCGYAELFDGMMAGGAREKLDRARRYVEKLCEATLKFRERYTEFKKENNFLEFSDIEYYTYKILQDPECRQALRQRYRYIFVDEFQDTNRMQDEIISLLSSGDNLFIVGDLKQSIYRFRGAENEIFREKNDSNDFANMTLGKNFRSDRRILDFINKAFSLVMYRSFSLNDYASEGMLEGDKVASLSDGRPPVVIDIFPVRERAEGYPGGVYSVWEHAAQNRGSLDEAGAVEGAHIAREIKKLVGKEKLQLSPEEMRERAERGKGEYVTYDDITILVRAKKDFTEGVYGSLLEAGIPVAAELSFSIDQYHEITQLISYLKLIDNFRQDIPLLASLKGCFGRFSDDELAQVRIKYREGEFYQAVLSYMGEQVGELAARLKGFYEKVRRYAELSKALPCPRLIMAIIEDFKYEDYLLGLENGADCVERVDNFLSLIYDKAYSQNLTEFLRYLEYASQDIRLGFKAGGGADKVRLCTMHSSKGLEFPIVFIAGCGQSFYSEAGRKLSVHKNYGIAMDFFELERLYRESSFIKKALDLLARQEQVKEEINLLYVAMTRAKYRLYLCGHGGLDEQPLYGLSRIKGAKRFSAFILNLALRDARNHGKIESDLYFEEDFGLEYELNIHSLPEAEREQPMALKAEEQDPPFEPLKGYPFQKSTSCPLKNSVTSLSKKSFSGELDEEPQAGENRLFFADSADIGTAYHAVLSEIDLSAGEEEAKRLIEVMAQRKAISKEQAEMVDPKKVVKVLSLPAIRALKGWRVFREKPFVAMISAGKAGLDAEDNILVQGVVDVLGIKDGEMAIIDYKYSSSSSEALIERYGRQLELYSLAAEQALGLKAVKKIIINIKTMREIPL
ncbi:MAG: UvrD-helicase domain-containing protein [Clostridiales bacterium]|jgi:ATP-dependent helicase/nuclease subunit A|nr:UvrD-helicase domain-containing protein [Clostridiales bacterium]